MSEGQRNQEESFETLMKRPDVQRAIVAKDIDQPKKKPRVDHTPSPAALNKLVERFKKD
jgi:hypothetical protein